jgi:gamma-glutamyl hercynylcysteine S-oxide hydrolase
MCRHLAYLGPARSLGALLCDPPHGLFRQSWAPRHQRHGTVNADGFGVGWYADGDPVPARYRRGGPIWADPSFADLARVVSSGAVLAAVRSATPGQAAGDAAAAPFADGEWLFSHNGCLFDWPASGEALTAKLPAAALLGVEALTDSGVLWALVRHSLTAGAPAGAALADTALRVRQVADGRFNMLLTDGRRVLATADGDTLVYRKSSGEVLVCSEPVDDEGDWVSVPDGSLLAATTGRVEVTPLDRVRRTEAS